jgi:beta-lactamase class A
MGGRNPRVSYSAGVHPVVSATSRGTISVWVGPPGASTGAFEHAADAPHYAASTMKVAVLAALYRTADLDREVPVVNDFASAKAGAPRFALPLEDQDNAVRPALGSTMTLRELARHMIVRSSNLATNIVLGHVGIDAVATVLRDVGAPGMRVERGIDDAAARSAGFTNVITARDLSMLMGAIATGRLSGSAEMIDVLCAQEYRVDLAVGLPAGTRIAHKNGWVTGVRHSTGVVYPDDAPPYVITVATTGTGNDGDACSLIARIAAASWADRQLY